MTQEQMIELARRAVACRGWRWMPGMKVIWPNGNEFRVGQVTGIDGQNDLPNYPSNGWGDEFPDRTKGLPDLTDPATLGCLLALVREAWGMPTGITVSYSSDEGLWGVSWCGATHGGWCGRGDTEAEALVAALESAP